MDAALDVRGLEPSETVMENGSGSAEDGGSGSAEDGGARSTEDVSAAEGGGEVDSEDDPFYDAESDPSLDPELPDLPVLPERQFFDVNALEDYQSDAQNTVERPDPNSDCDTYIFPRSMNAGNADYP